MMRRFANNELKMHCNMTPLNATIAARSCVSQRDIQRVFIVYEWFQKLFHKDEELRRQKHNKERALLSSLGVVYYLRLNEAYRREYCDAFSRKISGGLSFREVFDGILNYFIRKVKLPNGIARTVALKENMLAIIVCVVNHIPIIIVGAPGSSKTLSFNQVMANLKGQESKERLFSDTTLFKALNPHYYQCSRRTTSNEVISIFKKAISRQHYCDSNNMNTYCVVFMDEAGLPEDHHESLKVLHYHLDKQEVSFVAITNHILDAAKTNRAVSLFRPDPTEDDLKTLAQECLSFSEYPQQDKTDNMKYVDHFCQYVNPFCRSYTQLMEKPKLSNIFGLRDFIHFINYLRRNRFNKVLSFPQLVLESLERNFNGTVYFKDIAETFLHNVDSDINNVSLNGNLKAFQNSLIDVPKIYDSENEVRYKLIIDSTEDDSLVRTLYSVGILDRHNTRMFMCSNFPADGELQKIDTIAAIRHSAMKGHTVIMSQTDDIHESFYDLFNQHFRRIDYEKCPRYYTNIAFGAHHKLSRVHQEFKCIVVIKQDEINNTPSPFLNRFEKYLITHEDVIKRATSNLPPNLLILVNTARDKVKLRINYFHVLIHFHPKLFLYFVLI